MDETWDGADCEQLFLNHLEPELCEEILGTADPHLGHRNHPTCAPSHAPGDMGLQTNRRVPTTLVNVPANARRRNEPWLLEDSHQSDATTDELHVAFEVLRANGYLPATGERSASVEVEFTGHPSEKERRAMHKTLGEEAPTLPEGNEDPYKNLQDIQDPEERRKAKRLARNRLSAKRARERTKLRLHQLEIENRKLVHENNNLTQMVTYLFARLKT